MMGTAGCREFVVVSANTLVHNTHNAPATPSLSLCCRVHTHTHTHLPSPPQPPSVIEMPSPDAAIALKNAAWECVVDEEGGQLVRSPTGSGRRVGG